MDGDEDMGEGEGEGEHYSDEIDPIVEIIEPRA